MGEQASPTFGDEKLKGENKMSEKMTHGTPSGSEGQELLVEFTVCDRKFPRSQWYRTHVA